MKTIFGALALCGMAFALSGNATGQTLIGEWQLAKTFCEGGKVLHDLPNTNIRRIFDKIIATEIRSSSAMDKAFKAKNCALHIKASYSIAGDEYKLGPFLELESPNCPSMSAHMISMMRFSASYLIEKYGKDRASGIINFNTFAQRIKDGTLRPVKFKISDDNRELRTFMSHDKDCPNTLYVKQYDRIK